MKKTVSEDQRQILRVCEMYYNKGISKSEIAKKLNISRPTINKMLKRAKELGIVTITVNDILNRKYYNLEQELEDTFGLREVFITDTLEDREQTRQLIGSAAADMVDRFIENNSIIGVSLGYTLESVVSNIKSKFLPNTTFLPLVGGFNNMPQEIQGNSLAQNLAKNFNGTALTFYSPIRIQNENLRRELASEASVREVFDKAKKMDIALVGIGSINDESTIIKTGYISPRQKDNLIRRGMVGDACIQFYNIEGNTKLYEINKEILTIDLDQLREVKNSIGVSFGLNKADAIIGAINGGFINTLVTDLETAKKLMEMKDKLTKNK